MTTLPITVADINLFVTFEVEMGQKGSREQEPIDDQLIIHDLAFQVETTPEYRMAFYDRNKKEICIEVWKYLKMQKEIEQLERTLP